MHRNVKSKTPPSRLGALLLQWTIYQTKKGQYY